MYIYEIKKIGQFTTIELVHAQNDAEALRLGAAKTRMDASTLYVNKRP